MAVSMDPSFSLEIPLSSAEALGRSRSDEGICAMASAEPRLSIQIIRIERSTIVILRKQEFTLILPPRQLLNLVVFKPEWCLTWTAPKLEYGRGRIVRTKSS